VHFNERAYSSSISLAPESGESRLTPKDEEAILGIVRQEVEALGFKETPAARRLQMYPVREVYPYRAIATFGEVVGDPHVSILVEIETGRTEIRLTVRDLDHGGPTALTNQVMGSVRESLSESFPRLRMEIKDWRTLKLFSA
jgi:hypothetical protein